MLQMAQAAPSVAYEQPLYLALEECIYSLPETDNPQKEFMLELQDECPHLAEVMAGSSLIRQIKLNSETPISAYALRGLYNLLRRANHAELNQHQLNHHDLPAILKDAYLPQPEAGKTLGQIFMDWLGKKVQGKVDVTYLKEMVDWLSKYLPIKTLAEYLTYAAILILLVLALGLLIYQLYEAKAIPQFNSPNWLKRFRRPIADREIEPEIDLHALKTLPLNRQPGAILTWCVNRLLKLGLLADARDRTNHELLQYLRKSFTPSITTPFKSIVELAERSVYGNVPPDEKQINTLYSLAELFSADELRLLTSKQK